MALHSLYCAAVPLRSCSLTHSLTAPKHWCRNDGANFSCYGEIFS